MTTPPNSRLDLWSDPEPATHMGALISEVKGDPERIDRLVYRVSELGEPCSATALDLRSTTTLAAESTLRVFVEEGPYYYSIAEAAAGWGSLIAGVYTATVAWVLFSDRSAPIVIGRAEVRTDPLRPAQNASTFVRAAIVLLTQPCMTRPTYADSRRFADAKVPRVGLVQKLLRSSRRVSRALKNRLINWREERREQWSIGFFESSKLRHGEDLPWPDVRWLTPPADGFIADPFLVRHREKLLLFYERLTFAENKGTLWVAELDTDVAALKSAREVMNHPFHLSFPNVFSIDNHWYMLPEQARSGKTTLYRAADFPNRWEPAIDLLPDFPGIDPVLFWHHDRWWLFVTLGEPPCTDNNLHLYSCDRLDGRFEAHPANPVRVGLHGSRMAGRVFLDHRRLIRPGQDCGKGYGSGVALFEIEQLDRATYQEREICTLSPPAGSPFESGFHAYEMSDNWFALDGLRKSRPSAPIRR